MPCQVLTRLAAETLAITLLSFFKPVWIHCGYDVKVTFTNQFGYLRVTARVSGVFLQQIVNKGQQQFSEK